MRKNINTTKCQGRKSNLDTGMGAEIDNIKKTEVAALFL
jgi:hypothetical protein